jgi:hypothetical protein
MIRFTSRSLVLLTAVGAAVGATVDGAHVLAQQTATPLEAAGAARYEREIQPAGAGPNRLVQDEWLTVAGAPNKLADLRLYDRAGQEVPYLLVPPVSPARQFVTGDLMPLRPTKEASGFEMMLGEPTVVDRLRIGGLRAPFLKRATLEGSGDREHWTMLAAEATLFDLPDERLTQTEVLFTPGEYRYLRLTWNDRNSGVVPMPVSVDARRAAGPPEPAPLRVPLQLQRRGSEPGRTRYRITLPAMSLPLVALEIEAGDPNILRSARVSEPRLSDDRLVPFQLGQSMLRRASRGDVTVADLRIPIQVPNGTQIDLVIDDGSNAPLALTGVMAIMRPQPWIYFDSPDGQPLIARLGDPTLKAPRYDLEAVRPNLAAIAAVAAGWGSAPELRTTPSAPDVSSALLGAPLVGAALDVSRFRYARTVPTGPPGLTALSLDAAVLAHSRLFDLRLGNANGHQLAYLLEARDEPLAIAIDPLSAAPPPAWVSTYVRGAGQRTTYVLRLAHETTTESRLVLSTDARIFTRQLSVFVEQGAARPSEMAGARRLASSAWTHADPHDPAPQLTITLPPFAKRELVLMVDEGDNAPLKIESARLLLPGFALRFFRTDDSPLTLYYGDDSLGAPRYDLALLKPYLLGVPATDLVAAPEQQPAPIAPPRSMPIWAFWSVLVIAVMVLLALIWRLLLSEQTPSPPDSSPRGERAL